MSTVLSTYLMATPGWGSTGLCRSWENLTSFCGFFAGPPFALSHPCVDCTEPGNRPPHTNELTEGKILGRQGLCSSHFILYKILHSINPLNTKDPSGIGVSTYRGQHLTLAHHYCVEFSAPGSKLHIKWPTRLLPRLTLLLRYLPQQQCITHNWLFKG